MPYLSSSARICVADRPLSVNSSMLPIPQSLSCRSTSSRFACAAAFSPKPMTSANVNSWIEILLTGTPRPVRSGWAAAAGGRSPLAAASRGRDLPRLCSISKQKHD